MNDAPSGSPTITVVGDISVDLVMGSIERWPDVGTETLMARSELRAGGSGGNTALALRALGVPCRLVAQCGADMHGRWLREQLADTNAAIGVIEGSTTSVSVGVIHQCGERSFLTTRGHLELCDWASLLALAGDRPAPGSIAMLTGVFLQPRLLAGYPDALRTLRDRGYRIAIDTGWPSGGWTEERRADALRAFASCDYVLLNEAEVCALAGTQDLRQAMDELARQLPADCELIAKRGAQGALARRRDTFFEQPAEEIAVFDTIGAGDAFNAGYLAARLRGEDVGAALRAGCATAAAIIAQFPRRSFGVSELRT